VAVLSICTHTRSAVTLSDLQVQLGTHWRFPSVSFHCLRSDCPEGHCLPYSTAPLSGSKQLGWRCVVRHCSTLKVKVRRQPHGVTCQQHRCYCAEQLADSTVALVPLLSVSCSCSAVQQTSLLFLSQMNPLPTVRFCISVLPTIYACVFPSCVFPSVIPLHSTCQAHPSLMQFTAVSFSSPLLAPSLCFPVNVGDPMSHTRTQHSSS
jgi:hypothetical protein